MRDEQAAEKRVVLNRLQNRLQNARDAFAEAYRLEAMWCNDPIESPAIRGFLARRDEAHAAWNVASRTAQGPTEGDIVVVETPSKVHRIDAGTVGLVWMHATPRMLDVRFVGRPYSYNLRQKTMIAWHGPVDDEICDMLVALSEGDTWVADLAREKLEQAVARRQVSA